MLFWLKDGVKRVTYLETLESGALKIINESGRIELAYEFELDYASPQDGTQLKKNAS